MPHALLLLMLYALLLIVLPALCWLVHEQYQPRPRVQVRVGYSFMTGRDCEVFIGWRRNEHATGYTSYQRSIELTWDWLPTLYWARCADITTRWTGRARTIAGWSWYGRIDVRGARNIMLWSF